MDFKETRRINVRNVIIKIFIFVLFCSIGILGGLSQNSKVYADTKKVIDLYAYYEGSSHLIGEEIDRSKIVVQATYDDGSTVTVSDYTLTSSKVSADGTNTYVVVFGGKSAKFTVIGKKVISLSASYFGDLVSIGNKPDLRKITAYATYSDYSSEEVTDFNLYNDIITKTGDNVVSLRYQNISTTFSVYGIAAKSVTALYATYQGSGVSVGSIINPRDLMVTAVYADGDSEVINNYTLSPAKITAVGPQNVIVAFRGKTVSIQVSGVEKSIVGIKVSYKGGTVAVGNSVRASDIEVIATYNDGTTTKLTSFNILSSSITYVGYHLVTVEASGYTGEFVVEGVSEKSVNYSNASTFSVTNGKHKANVALALYSNVDKTKIAGTTVEPSAVRNLIKRSAKYNYYIAFDVELLDENLDEEFPITMKITLPNEYKSAGCSVYYTPNKKSVIGRLDSTITGTNEITCTIYYPGTYILTYLK